MADDTAAVFPHQPATITLHPPYLQQAWTEILDSLHFADGERAEIERDTARGEGFLWALDAAELITEPQYGILRERLTLASQAALRRLQGEP